MVRNGRKTLAELDKLIAGIQARRRDLDQKRIKASEKASVRQRLAEEIKEVADAAGVMLSSDANT